MAFNSNIYVRHFCIFFFNIIEFLFVFFLCLIDSHVFVIKHSLSFHVTYDNSLYPPKLVAFWNYKGRHPNIM